MYLKKTWRLKNRIEVRKYHTARYGVKGEKRREKTKPTKEGMQKINERNAIKKLLRLIRANFETGDAFLTLAFAEEMRPKTLGEARWIHDIFIRRMRARYKKQDIELKWISAAEFMNKHIHFHIIINNIQDFNRIIRECWTWGGVNISPLWENGNYEQLAEYMLKETSKTAKMTGIPFSQRYRRSRNLVDPEKEAKTEVIKASSWRDEPTVPKEYAERGYVLDKESVYSGVDAWGYPFQEYAFVSYGAKKENKKRTAEKTRSKGREAGRGKKKNGSRTRRGGYEVTAKEYLRQIGAMETKTDLDLDRVVSIRESIRRVKAVHYGETKTRAKGVDRMAGELGELEALEQRTAGEIKELEKMKTGITEQIKKVKSQKYIKLLYLRYVKGENWRRSRKRWATH